jgi:hypothetical protein
MVTGSAPSTASLAMVVRPTSGATPITSNVFMVQ